MQYLLVQDVTTGETLPGFPSARLIQAGRGEAYVECGIVYLRERGYESSDGSYHQVRVIKNPEYPEYPL